MPDSAKTAGLSAFKSVLFKCPVHRARVHGAHNKRLSDESTRRPRRNIVVGKACGMGGVLLGLDWHAPHPKTDAMPLLTVLDGVRVHVHAADPIPEFLTPTTDRRLRDGPVHGVLKERNSNITTSKHALVAFMDGRISSLSWASQVGLIARSLIIRVLVLATSRSLRHPLVSIAVFCSLPSSYRVHSAERPGTVQCASEGVGVESEFGMNEGSRSPSNSLVPARPRLRFKSSSTSAVAELVLGCFRSGTVRVGSAVEPAPVRCVDSWDGRFISWCNALERSARSRELGRFLRSLTGFSRVARDRIETSSDPHSRAVCAKKGRC
ncbi:hypothetical protein DFP72DRAFT_1081700 [Ephemerocybe angulata]|uniref:Uncharacterized protein n=1 Tax=Ephemerocybe angulata TaxID=980116 RepID=A0A8H6H8Q9_9AGAR|nr:hypothetical protein DFP72DRAFT_1081700 [Tulosesus angulatus]